MAQRQQLVQDAAQGPHVGLVEWRGGRGVRGGAGLWRWCVELAVPCIGRAACDTALASNCMACQCRC